MKTTLGLTKKTLKVQKKPQQKLSRKRSPPTKAKLMIKGKSIRMTKRSGKEIKQVRKEKKKISK
jgi:hypothetical protein